MDTLTKAESLFQRISKSANPYQEIMDIVNTEKRPEDMILDYKVCPIKDGDLDRPKVRELCSKNYGAFANTEGGLLIWGVDCPNGSPPSIQEVPCLNKLEAYLSSVVRETNEPVVNVELFKIPSAANPDYGFIVSFVPISPTRPHRADWAEGTKFYYPFRAGDTVKEFSHSHLRQMFYPYTKVDLNLTYKAKFVDANNKPKISITLEIQNKGTATATEIVAVFKSHYRRICRSNEDDLNGIAFHCANFTEIIRPSADSFQVLYRRPLHPTFKDEFGFLEIANLPVEGRSLSGGRDSYAIGRDIEFEHTLYCKDAEPKSIRVNFDHRQVNLILDIPDSRHVIEAKYQILPK